MMKNELVKDWMTKNTVTVDPDTPLPDAHAIMKEYKIRRLPVVGKNGKLVGIISLTDVHEAEPSDATTLSIYELNYLISRLLVSKIMTREVRTTTPNSGVSEVARLMLDYKIGGVPVVENEKLVGIITESDIFRMVVKTMSD